MDGVIDGEHLVGQTIKLGEQVHCIQGGARLERCTIDIVNSGRRFVLGDCLFEDCTIKTRRRLNDVRFSRTQFLGCRFQGKFCGCDFGAWPFPEHPELGGSTKRCDFRRAHLHLCRFGQDTDANLWPCWPHLVVLSPHNHKRDWSELPLSVTFDWAVSHTLVGDEPQFVEAFVLDLSEIDPEVDPEIFWPYLQDLSWLTFAEKESKSRVEMPESSPAQYSPEAPPVSGLIYEGWLLEVRQTGHRVELVFDMTRAQPKEYLPERLVLVLTQVSRAKHRAQGREQPLSEVKPGSFKVRGFERDGETLVLKGQSKKAGFIEICHGAERVLLEDGSEADAGQLFSAIERYWMEL